MDELRWPFVGSEALADKVIPERAMRTLYAPVYPNVYVARDIDITATQRAKAAWLWSDRHGVVAGRSAAALLGTKWIDGVEPAELIWNNRRAPSMLVVHSDTLLSGEVIDIDGISATTPARTAFDIGRRTRRIPGIQQLDALANATGLTIADVEAVIARHKGARGIRHLRDVLPLMDGGAESPQETRTRLVLIDGGLPKPETQIRVFTEHDDFVGRIDMGYREYLVGVEYDGPQHWTDPEQRRRDIDRQVGLTECGWIIIRVSSEMLRHYQGTILSRVQAALISRGWPTGVNLATLPRRVA